MMRPPLSAIAAELPSTVPFVGPEAQERARGIAFRARIGANESVFGPSDNVIEAMRKAAPEMWQYCDPENHDLKHALAAWHGVAPDNICVGEGIDGLFGTTARLFVEPGTKVATSAGAYPTFNFQVAGAGGEIVTVPYVDDREDPASLLELARREGARMIYLANPDNPMGTWWRAGELQAMINDLPEGVVLCLDEAYGEFAPAGTMPDLDVHNPQVLRFRTFSKAYGLAGLRVGYVIGEAQVIKAYDKIRNHFGVNRMAQVAAEAALADEDWLDTVVVRVHAARSEITRIAHENGLEVIPSATNFVAIDCGHDGPFAKAVMDSLLQQGVFVRMPGVAPLNRCIRVTAGREHHLDIFEQALPKALAAAHG
ncbi:MAG: pyridoxal phosphate-dependent aminotransferase [Anderseniella sp.]|jgi:histidinol-phosphate aminotransferase|nr:pyridoxal phosphate-dependent aminotransferase [Anderseniella sp.]